MSPRGRLKDNQTSYDDKL